MKTNLKKNLKIGKSNATLKKMFDNFEKCEYFKRSITIWFF